MLSSVIRQPSLSGKRHASESGSFVRKEASAAARPTPCGLVFGSSLGWAALPRDAGAVREDVVALDLLQGEGAEEGGRAMPYLRANDIRQSI